MSKYHNTDSGNANRFEDIYKDTVKQITGKQITGTKQWVQWLPDVGWRYVNPIHLTKAVVSAIYENAAASVDDKGQQNSLSAELANWGKFTESYGAKRSMLNLVDMGISIDRFDINPKVINCRNGILDLNTKTLSKHSPDQLHLKRANIDYKPDAKCERWNKFLNQVLDGDKELIHYVKVAAGYSIMGLTEKHCFFLCYGSGRNGKGSFLRTIKYVLGSYADDTRFETLLHNDQTDVRVLEAIGKLKGLRFVIASEPNENTRFNEALIKKLTGADALEGTVLGKSSFTFEPTHTLWLGANHKPQIKDPTLAMWSRVKTIPFPNTYTGNNQIANLEEQLKLEADGIFNWLVEGACEYLHTGFPDEPKAIQIANEEYENENNKLSMFTRDHLQKIPGHNVLANTIYEEYKVWWDNQNPEERGELISQQAFPKALVDQGYKRKDKKTNQGVLMLDCKLVSEEVTLVTHESKIEFSNSIERERDSASPSSPEPKKTSKDDYRDYMTDPKKPKGEWAKMHNPDWG